MPFFGLFLSFFSSQQAPGLIQFSFAKLLELLKYDNKNNELLVQRSSLCLTSRDRGKPSPTFTFAFRLPNCFSFKVLYYSALVLSTKTWYLFPAVAHTALTCVSFSPSSPFLQAMAFCCCLGSSG